MLRDVVFSKYLLVYAFNKVTFTAQGFLLFCVMFHPNRSLLFFLPVSRASIESLPCCHGPAISVREVFEDGRLNLYEQFAGSNGESVTAVISQLHLFMYSGACSPQTGLCAIECSSLLSHLFQNRTNLSLEAPVF